MKPPRDVRSRFVVIPYMLHVTNVAAHIKNVDVMDVLVYIRKIADKVAPFKAAYRTKRAVAVEAFIF